MKKIFIFIFLGFAGFLTYKNFSNPSHYFSKHEAKNYKRYFMNDKDGDVDKDLESQSWGGKKKTIQKRACCLFHLISGKN
jgi:hypothetical protein